MCRSSVACGRVWLSPERKQGSTHASVGVKQCQLQRPGFVIVDAQQLLYHVVWPCGGSVGVLAAESLKARLALCPATEKSSFLTSMQMNWPMTTRGAGELVLAPPHSTWL